MGGSQRLTRAVGKAKAMEMCLTGRMMDTAEAERSGLVARVVAHESLVEEAMKTATAIAAMPPMAAMVNKDMVNAAYETTLDQGLIRSEEHTSELQSLMRISYAVFSLKKKRYRIPLHHRRLIQNTQLTTLRSITLTD